VNYHVTFGLKKLESLGDMTVWSAWC